MPRKIETLECDTCGKEVLYSDDKIIGWTVSASSEVECTDCQIKSKTDEESP